jgi:hypothetical protein
VSHKNIIIWQFGSLINKNCSLRSVFKSKLLIAFYNSSIVFGNGGTIFLRALYIFRRTYDTSISSAVMVCKLEKFSEISVRKILLGLVYRFSIAFLLHLFEYIFLCILGWSCPLYSFTISTIYTIFFEDVCTFAVHVLTVQCHCIEQFLDLWTFRYVKFLNNYKSLSLVFLIILPTFISITYTFIILKCEI